MWGLFCDTANVALNLSKSTTRQLPGLDNVILFRNLTDNLLASPEGLADSSDDNKELLWIKLTNIKLANVV